MSAVNTVQLSDLPKLLAELRHEKFYGRISFDVRKGEVTLIRTERTQLVKVNDEGANRDGSEYLHRR